MQQKNPSRMEGFVLMFVGLNDSELGFAEATICGQAESPKPEHTAHGEQTGRLRD
jgi:hypothetical protein